MLKKSFSLASAVSLGGAVVWIAASAACGGEEDPVTPTADSGTSETSTTSSSSSSSSSSGSGGIENPKLAKDPATVPGATVPFTTCQTFTACGGNVIGEYEVSGGCLSDKTFDGFKQFCSGVNVHDVVIKASGTVKIDAQKVARTQSIFVHAEIDVPKDAAQCAAIQFAGTCSGLAGLLKSGATGGGPKFDDVQCVDGPTTCLCTAQATVAETTNDDYTTANGVLTANSSPKRTFDYCTTGKDITYRESTKDNASFSMLLNLKSTN